MGTADGSKHVKFSWSVGREGPYSPANEALGAAIIERLGIARPERWLVDVPDWMIVATAELAGLRSTVGLGTDWLPGWGLELQGGQIVIEAASAPIDELLVQHLVMNWLQVGDHSHNFVKDGNRVVAVDFASGPNSLVWEGGAPLGTTISDHGGLSAILAGAPVSVRDGIRATFDALDDAALQPIFDDLPDSWVTPTQRARVQAELLRTKGAIRVVVEP